MTSRTTMLSLSYSASAPKTAWCALVGGMDLFVNAIRHQEGTSGAT